MLDHGEGGLIPGGSVRPAPCSSEHVDGRQVGQVTASTFDSYLRAVSSGDSGNGALRRIKLRHRKDDAA